MTALNEQAKAGPGWLDEAAFMAWPRARQLILRLETGVNRLTGQAYSSWTLHSGRMHHDGIVPLDIAWRREEYRLAWQAAIQRAQQYRQVLACYGPGSVFLLAVDCSRLTPHQSTEPPVKHRLRIAG